MRNKTGSGQHIVTPPEEDRATAIVNTHKIGENGHVVRKMCLRTNSQTNHTNRQTRSSLYSPE